MSAPVGAPTCSGTSSPARVATRLMIFSHPLSAATEPAAAVARSTVRRDGASEDDAGALLMTSLRLALLPARALAREAPAGAIAWSTAVTGNPARAAIPVDTSQGALRDVAD